ncbi:hypothetical protein [uncultured Tateyamaria sp.]|uniref:hypothetical protein n=1 Tax=uncultured Tateyamaria sp. TaxID=455651 RepID=UPI002638292D|nr:hypothetical protein [uncultured Tateyamaria sp.]
MRAILALVLMVFGFAASAEPSLDRQLFDKVQDGDFIAVQALIKDAQQRFERDDLSADDMRDLFIVLSRSHPKTTTFVKEWLNRDTGNHYARIARAWSLWNAAGAIASSRNGWSYDVARKMRDQGVLHARFAYTVAPGLIPASDAVIVMYGYDKQVGDPVAAVNRVMDSHPNWGTLQRAYDFVGRYGMEAIATFCQEYATRISDEARTLCLMYGQTVYGDVRNQDIAEWPDYNPDNPDMVTVRLLNMMNNFGHDTVSEAQLDWIESAFVSMEPDLYELMDLDRWASTFQNRFGLYHKRRNMKNKMRRAHLERSLAFLEMDPLNLRLLDMVEDVQFELPWITVFNADGSATTRRVNSDESEVDKAERLEGLAKQKRDFSVRRLHAAPYSSDFWHRYASAHIQSDFSQYYAYEDAEINALVYESDIVRGLDLYLLSKTRQVQTYYDAQKDGATPQWVKAAESVDFERDILCPFVRAERLRAHICEHDADVYPSCAEHIPLMEESYAIVVDMARDTPHCNALREAEIDTLWYTPIPLQDVLPPLN